MDKKHKSLNRKFIIFSVLTITLILSIVYVILYFNTKNIIEKQLVASL